jgi:glyoxylase-like metal-dependent hydrolase (beta-lactamase superfamily II)
MFEISPDHRAVVDERLDLPLRALSAAIMSYLLRPLAAAFVLALAACSAPVPDSGEAWPPLQAVADHVYVQRGADEAPTPRNRGAVGNLGVIAGPTGVIVIGTGSSRDHGEALLREIARLEGKPVVLAIDPQASPDQVLGNAAFEERGVQVLAHRETDLFMREHCDACILEVKSTADSPALAASHPAWPTQLVDGSRDIEAGGRRLRLLYYGWTEQPGSLAVLDLQSGVLFTGDIASFGTVPQAQLSQLGAWIEALDRLRALDVKLVVPGHGPAGPPQRLQEAAGYLRTLRERVSAAYRRGDGLLETVQTLELPEYHDWPLYREHHRRNVHQTYLQVEAEELRR